MTKNYSMEILEKIKNDFTREIEQYVIEDLQEHGYQWYIYLQNIVNHGCVSGIVTNLITYKDQIEFHDKYESEIDEIIQEYLDSTGKSFSNLVDKMNFEAYEIDMLKNWKSWFAFETVASTINNSLENGEYDEISDDLKKFLDDMEWISGYDSNYDRDDIVKLFENVGEMEIIEYNQRLSEDNILFDVNLSELVKYCTESGMSINEINTSDTIKFYYCDDNNMYVVTH